MSARASLEIEDPRALTTFVTLPITEGRRTGPQDRSAQHVYYLDSRVGTSKASV